MRRRSLALYTITSNNDCHFYHFSKTYRTRMSLVANLLLITLAKQYTFSFRICRYMSKSNIRNKQKLYQNNLMCSTMIHWWGILCWFLLLLCILLDRSECTHFQKGSRYHMILPLQLAGRSLNTEQLKIWYVIYSVSRTYFHIHVLSSNMLLRYPFTYESSQAYNSEHVYLQLLGQMYKVMKDFLLYQQLGTERMCYHHTLQSCLSSSQLI